MTVSASDAHRATEKLREKIAMLLKKAESTTFEAERETFSRAAEKLMIKHGIERAQLQDPDNNRSGLIRTHWFILHSKTYGKVQMQGLIAIARALGMDGYYENHKDFITVFVVGFPEDLHDLGTLWKSLDIQSQAALKHWSLAKRGEIYNWAREGWKYRRSFISGFLLGAAKRVREVRSEAVQEATGSTEVVLARDSAVKREFGKIAADLGIRSKRSRIQDNINARSAGFARGVNAEINRSVRA